MADKRTSLEEAAALLQDGETLALGGMTLYRRPVAFVRALLRRDPHPRDLTLLAFTLAPMFTQAAASGDLEVVEETEASLAFGLRARPGWASCPGWAGWGPLHRAGGDRFPRHRLRRYSEMCPAGFADCLEEFLRR